MTGVLDPTRLLGAPLPTAAASWTDQDVMLYHLGLGAGSQTTDERELRYIYERDLTVLPSFATVACTPSLKGFREIEGLDLSKVVVLHADQTVEVAGPIPVEAKVVHSGRLAGLVDRGEGALATFEVETRNEDDHTLIFRNVVGFYLRGLGGFGGDSLPPRVKPKVPDREPDAKVEVPLMHHQAFIYRLSGDRNPLHVDRAVAARAGFDHPLLHGLCTYGVVCKAVADNILDARPEDIATYRGFFTGYVFPGETLAIRIWTDCSRIITVAESAQRRSPAFVGEAILR